MNEERNDRFISPAESGGQNEEAAGKAASCGNETTAQGAAPGENVAAEGDSPRRFKLRDYPTWGDVAGMIGIIVVAMILAGILDAVLMLSGMQQGPATALSYAVQMALPIIFIAAQIRARGSQRPVLRFFAGRVNPFLLLWGLVLIGAVGVVIDPLLSFFPSGFMDMLSDGIGRGGWAVLMTVLLAPIMEETLFRGLILGSIRARRGAVAAIFVSAAIFGLIHIIPQQVVNAFFVGIILGYIYYKTESLATVIILHALNNAVAYLQMELLGEEYATMTLRQMIPSDALYYIIYGVSLALTVVGAVSIVRSLSRDRLVEAETDGEQNAARPE